MYRKAAELAPRDARIWANLGDAYRLISEGGLMEQEAYREAASLLREQLAASPEQPFLHALLGHVFARNGDDSHAVGELVHTRELGSRDPQTWYYVALTEMSLGNDEAARSALRSGLDLGFPSTCWRPIRRSSRWTWRCCRSAGNFDRGAGLQSEQSPWS
jgi:Flp pilus assembly protein TadD